MITPKTFAEALVLTGPTGSGKSAFAVELAHKLNAEIISMDSMALYRGMDIGTAKPTREERQGIPHHLMDVLDPWESSTVAWWLEEAARLCRDISERGKTVFIVGGTPFYLKAMMAGLFDGPPADEAIRDRLTKLAEQKGKESLHRQLTEVDPPTAKRLHPNDVRRVIRALEVYELTGKPMSDWQQQWQHTSPSDSPDCVWLDMPREHLYERINRRVEEMFQCGLIHEVQRLLELPKQLSKEARQALGYKEVIRHLRGEMTLADTIAEVQTRTRQFAKRQITWFRHLQGCQPLSRELTMAHWQGKMK